jgi:cysteine desulfurase
MNVIYLDHNSTTPLLDEVAAAMREAQSRCFGNPSSQHQVGRRARQVLEHARGEIGRMLGAQLTGRRADRVVLTSGGTEANNLALLGLARLGDPRAEPGEAIVSAIEHPSIAGVADFLERRGWTIHRLGVSREGVVDVAALEEVLTERTRFVSVMLANNETGIVQPVADVARRCRALGVPMHTDAVQMIGKLPVNFRALGVDSLSVAAHKFHGPLGAGALVVRHELKIEPILFGGFQQDALRPGTESVALAVGMQVALAAWEREGEARSERIQALRDRLEARIAASYGGRIVFNGAAVERTPHTSNMAFEGLERQALLMALDQAGVACSTGSACASGSSEPSTVLAAMGASTDVLAGSLRFSLGATTTAAEVDEAIERIARVAAKLLLGKPRHTDSIPPPPPNSAALTRRS